MPFLEKGTDFSDGDQVTPTNLDALVDSAKAVKNGSAVTNSGNTTDETTLDVDGSGQLKVKDGGIDTTQLATDAVTGAKVADDTIDSEHYAADSIDNEHMAADAVAGSGAGASGDNCVEASSIGHADLDNDIITGLTALTGPPADGDFVMISDTDDSGNKRKMLVSEFLQHAAIPKAYGRITWDSSSPALAGAYNLQNPTEPSSDVRQVEFINDMANTDYIVQLSYEDASGDQDRWGVYVVSRATGSFQFSTGNTEGSNRAVHITVFGTLA